MICNASVVSAINRPVPTPARTIPANVPASAAGSRRAAAEVNAISVTNKASAAPSAAIGANDR